ncbi:MAG: EamA family transporter [Thermoplasmata archaeon]|nr:EamA family transporter [Thermoplasmata archaeon]MCI4357207.1 EamA family transporter [Thermoplasmata archaeon]
MSDSTDAPASMLPLGVVIVAWGFNYVFVRIGLGFEPPLWLAAIRAGIGAVVLLTWLALSSGTEGLSRRERRDALLIGIPNTAVFFGLWFVAASAVSPGETAVIIYTFPLWVTLLASPFLGEHPTRVQLTAVATGFVGVVLISVPWNSGGPGLAPIAVVELLLAAIAWALGTVLFKRRFGTRAPASANGWQLVGGTFVLAASGLVVGGAPALPPTAFAWLVLLWLGAVGTALAYTIWFRLLAVRSAVNLSGYTFLVPLVALAASAVVLGERLLPLQFLGVAAVVFAIYLNARGARAAA